MEASPGDARFTDDSCWQRVLTYTFTYSMKQRGNMCLQAMTMTWKTEYMSNIE